MSERENAGANVYHVATRPILLFSGKNKLHRPNDGMPSLLDCSNAAAPITPRISFPLAPDHPQTDIFALQEHSSAAKDPSRTLSNSPNCFPPLGIGPVRGNKSVGFRIICCLDAHLLPRPLRFSPCDLGYPQILVTTSAPLLATWLAAN